MKKMGPFRSDFLFPDNNFGIGVGSVLNIGGDYFRYNYSRSGYEADIKAIANDWGVVGNDLRNAIINTHDRLTDAGHQLEFNFDL